MPGVLERWCIANDEPIPGAVPPDPYRKGTYLGAYIYSNAICYASCRIEHGEVHLVAMGEFKYIPGFLRKFYESQEPFKIMVYNSTPAWVGVVGVDDRHVYHSGGRKLWSDVQPVVKDYLTHRPIFDCVSSVTSEQSLRWLTENARNAARNSYQESLLLMLRALQLGGDCTWPTGVTASLPRITTS